MGASTKRAAAPTPTSTPGAARHYEELRDTRILGPLTKAPGHERHTYRYQGRDFRLTDVAGKVVREILM